MNIFKVKAEHSYFNENDDDDSHKEYCFRLDAISAINKQLNIFNFMKKYCFGEGDWYSTNFEYEYNNEFSGDPPHFCDFFFCDPIPSM